MSEFHDLLKKCALKVTPIRLEILRILKDSKKPMGVPELFKEVKKAGGNYVSVYRTIQALLGAGMIREINLRHGHTDYELVEEDNEHHHVVCVSCGMVEELVGCCDIARLTKKALGARSSFQAINDHALELFGICKMCAVR
jgi:Fur family ferric uptake transcriptional regulator